MDPNGMVPNMWLHPLLFTMVNGGGVFFEQGEQNGTDQYPQTPNKPETSVAVETQPFVI